MDIYKEKNNKNKYITKHNNDAIVIKVGFICNDHGGHE